MQAINYEIFTFSLLLLPGCTSRFSTATSVGSTSSGFQRWLHAQRVSPVTRPRSVEGTNSQVPQLNPLHPKSTRGECAGKSPVPVWVSLSSSEPPIRGLPNPLFSLQNSSYTLIFPHSCSVLPTETVNSSAVFSIPTRIVPDLSQAITCSSDVHKKLFQLT